MTLSGLITCQEQATGRLRWRTQMPGPEWGTSSGMLAARRPAVRAAADLRPHGGRVPLSRPARPASTLWSADIGGRYIWERAAPVAAAGKVAFGFGTQGHAARAP